MAIKKRSINDQGDNTDYPHLVSNYNDSSINNPSHQSDIPTNYVIKTITLEDCDRTVYEEFNKRFRVGEKEMPLIILDAELGSVHFQNFEQFDSAKEFLNGPFFTMFRKKAVPKFRTNPTYKKVIYSIPKQKKKGIIYEDWIIEGPLNYDLHYEFKFITNYRDSTNEFDSQMRHYFKNKRNIIVCNNERFSIGPEEFATLSELEIVNRDSIEQTTLYVSTYELKLECFTRDMSNVQKRERPNRFTLDITVNDGVNKPQLDKQVNFDSQEPYPKHPPLY